MISNNEDRRSKPMEINGSLRRSVVFQSADSDILIPSHRPPALLDSPMGNGRRSVVTSMRLQRQGFVGRERSADFALKSIRRGSTEWHTTLRPFVADIAFESMIQRRYQSETISFRPFSCYAAVLFVDLSNYSAITSALAARGAHALSSVVNEYLSRLLEIVRHFGGDVIKFAGDAVVIVWYSVLDKDLPINTFTAARCVLEMQKKAGQHPVDGTNLQFRIHCGLSCGLLESEVFSAPNHVNMQRLFHSIGGDALGELSELVDLAKAGEVCISDAVVNFLGSRGIYRDCIDANGKNHKLLIDLICEKDDFEKVDLHVLESIGNRQRKRQTSMEEEFIHPTVIKLLSHGGLSPMQISQMRNLCVLFIAMTSSIGSSVNWLMEVQAILDKHRCPIVQIIDDDKGVHLIAAVNLSESIPECSLLGLEICRELSAKQVGCAIGMASGSTFCGVIGSSDIACRWDIAGPTPVRAARLMQYALLSHTPFVAIDQSVYNDPMSFTRMKLFDSSVTVKGTIGPISVYTLSDSESSAAFRVLETVHAHIHDDLVDIITKHIRIDRPRVSVIVTGVPLSGKKIICQRAAGCANLVPYLHLSDASAGFLQLAKTIATWFRYVDDQSVNELAESVLDLIKKQHWSRSHDECIHLVDVALSKGFKACFLVDRIQFLDDFSVSIIRECLSEKRSNRRASLRPFSESTPTPGKVCFLCVHVSLYNWKSVNEVVEAISRLNDVYDVPVVRVGEAKKEDLRIMFRDLSDMEVEDRWLDAYSESSGNSAGYFIERAAASRALSGKLWSEGKRPYAETTEKLVLHIPYGLLRKNKTLPVSLVSAEHTMRFNQIFDELPPLFQTTLKVLTIASRNGFAYKLPRSVLWEVLNDLIADGVEMNALDIIISELLDMCIVKLEAIDDINVLSFQSPAFSDVAFDVSTPIQIQSIADALIDRLHPHVNDYFKVPLVMASLYCLLGRSGSKPLWTVGYGMLLTESVDWTEKELNKWKECIDDEISSTGGIATDVLDNFFFDKPQTKIVGKILPLLKIYSAPVAFGPMGHSLSVMTRNTFHELGSFHGTYTADTVNALCASTKSAALRYKQEMDIIENFLSENGFPAGIDQLQEERDAIMYIAEPALNVDEVQRKAATILDTFVPTFVEARLNRLYSLVNVLHDGPVPEMICKADVAILRAYEALRADKCTTDAVQDALVIMATMNWKPKPVPEYLPLLHYQTVARLRNKVLKRLSEAELFMFKHQQNHLDLEAFLLVTALLSPAEEGV